MQAPMPDAALFCPVCEHAIDLVWLWQEPGSSRIRIFCEDCSFLDDYARLPKVQRTVLSREEFQRFASRRLLTHVLERERAKGAGLPDKHVD
jgi:hypothetical protein